MKEKKEALRDLRKQKEAINAEIYKIESELRDAEKAKREEGYNEVVGKYFLSKSFKDIGISHILYRTKAMYVASYEGNDLFNVVVANDSKEGVSLKNTKVRLFDKSRPTLADLPSPLVIDSFVECKKEDFEREYDKIAKILFDFYG